MALRLSTGLRNALLGSASLKTALANGFINIYSGSQPASANDAITGSNTLLATIYSDGTATGIEFGDSADGAISKASGETWSGTAVGTGTAAWFRFWPAAGSPAGSSTTEARIDGSIAVSGGDMNISNTSIVSSAVQTVSSFTVTLPAS